MNASSPTTDTHYARGRRAGQRFLASHPDLRDALRAGHKGVLAFLRRFSQNYKSGFRSGILYKEHHDRSRSS